MPKFNFGLDSDLANEELGEFYTGPTPPKGNYTVVLKQLKSKPNVNKDQRVNMLLEITEEDGSDKAEYNGYGIWNGINVTQSGAPWLNNWLDALGGNARDAFYKGDVMISQKSSAGEFDILKIGTVKPVGLVLRVNTKMGDDGKGNERLEVSQFILDDDAPKRAGSRRSSDAEPPEDAAGLSDTAGNEEEPNESGEEFEPYTEEELGELKKPDLQGILDEWQVAYAANATIATLIKLILKTQEEDQAAADDGETGETGEEQAEDYTEEDLNELGKEDLVAYMEKRGWADRIPSPAVPSRLRKLILQLQLEPPF